MSKKNVLLIISSVIFVIGIAIVFAVAVTSGTDSNDINGIIYGSDIETDSDTESLVDPELAFLTEHDWIRSVDDTEHISFHRDGTFSYWCSCGNPVDNYDMYDSYEYKDDVITIRGYDADTSMRVIYGDEQYLCLYLEDQGEIRIFTDSEYAENIHIEHDPAEHAGLGWANLHVLDYDGESITFAPFNYDRDAHLEFDEYIRSVPLAENVEYYSVTTIDDNGEVTTEHFKLEAEDIQYLGEYYTGGYVHFDTEGKIRYIVFYGKTVIMG